MRKMEPTNELRPGEEDALANLLREAGPAARPPEEVTRRVRAAVEAEWRTVVRQRQARPVRRGPYLALAASVAVAAVAAWVALPFFGKPAGTPVATLSRVVGAVEAGVGTDWQPAAVRQRLRPGQALVTGPQGRAALSLGNGVTLRLDTDTRIALVAADRVVVDRGAVYLDSGSRPVRADPLVIESRFGTTRHLGTQYEVRVLPAGMRVSVREGRVEVAGEAVRTAEVIAGQALSVAADGAVQRQPVALAGADWAWTEEVVPPYAIEQRPLKEFLSWVSRETGRPVAFASPQAEASAADIVLRGSVAGLPPEAALAAVMATTPLDYAEDPARITVRMR